MAEAAGSLKSLGRINAFGMVGVHRFELWTR